MKEKSNYCLNLGHWANKQHNAVVNDVPDTAAHFLSLHKCVVIFQ